MLGRRFSLWASFVLLFLIVAVPSAITAGRAIETAFFPVVLWHETEVHSAKRIEPNVIAIKGRAFKARDCQFDNLKWYRGDRLDRAVRVTLDIIEVEKIRGIGWFKYGPWHVYLSPELKLEDTYADVWHQCYFMRRWFGKRFKYWWLTESRFYR